MGAPVAPRAAAKPGKGASRSTMSHFLDDDLVGTIEDDDAVPQYDDDSDAAPATAPAKAPKRKRAAEPEPTGKASKKQKLKQKKKANEAAADDSSDSDGGFDDGALDPDFEFAPGGLDDAGATGWNASVPGNDRSIQPLGIDEIIARRRAAKQAESGDVGADEEGEDVEDEDEDDNEGSFEDFDDDLALEAGNVETSDQDEATDNDSEPDEDGPAAPDENSDDDSVAEPVAHPDDLMDPGDSGESEPEDEIVTQRRDAFFAPEEPATGAPLSVTATSFHTMSLSRPILKGLAALGFSSPTPIQVKAVPLALLGKDIVGGAETGSGKTAAFVIPILERLLYRPKRVPTTRVGILMPTRELAVQCHQVAARLAKFTDISFALIVGGLSLREQEQTLKQRPDVVIATPGRFIDHMRNSASFAVENLEILVLDEADRMLADGFRDELNEILTTIPRGRQTMLFSATMTDDVDQLIRVGLQRPVRVMVDAKRKTVSGLVQEFIKVKVAKPEIETERRLAYLIELCTSVYTNKTIVFLPTKALAHHVKVLFSLRGIKAAELHGSMSQEQRLAAMSAFQSGTQTHLLATDIASRGLDIPRVETVINFTVPSSTETYLHRVGRTARAGQSGVSCTLFNGATKGENSSTSERGLLRPVLRLAKTQKAAVRTRNFAIDRIAKLTDEIVGLKDEIEEIMREEKEERLLAQTERDLKKGENLVKYGDEIASRPRRTWFQTETEKKAGQQAGQEFPSEKKEKKTPSNKQKKHQEAHEERAGGRTIGRKKGASERGTGRVNMKQPKGSKGPKGPKGKKPKRK